MTPGTGTADCGKGLCVSAFGQRRGTSDNGQEWKCGIVSNPVAILTTIVIITDYNCCYCSNYCHKQNTYNTPLLKADNHEEVATVLDMRLCGLLAMQDPGKKAQSKDSRQACIH